MAFVDVAIGWTLVIAGSVMLLIEAYTPGFFVAVPATVMIFLGILVLLGIDIFSSSTGIILGVVVALVTAGVTVWIYSRLTPNGSPTTISRDSIVGMVGNVIRTVDEDSINGKVTIGRVEWSARAAEGTIPAGKKVRVLRSEGVHIVVAEVE
ncbi:MAG: NfeD family protein [Methanomicrobiales archaeon]|nr:NfeD family protein [Methanomicrobiales archaeon]